MQLGPSANTDQLKEFLSPVVDRSAKRWRVIDQKRLREGVMEQLACNCLFGTPDVQLASMEAVWQVCQYMGTPYATPESLLEAANRDGIVDMIVPIVDARQMPFELLEIIMDAGNEMEVGPLLFAIDAADRDARAMICAVLCMAVKQNWQAPVLFYDGTSELPLETVKLDWRKMLYFNSYDLPRELLDPIVGELVKFDFDQLTALQWQALMLLPRECWEGLWGDIYDVYCDLFEELDVNETFSLLKRYLVPSWSRRTVFEIL